MLSSREWWRNYTLYLQSPQWQLFRQRALAYYNYSCRKCLSSRRLQVHHKNYDRVGRELLSDVEVLCFNCHSKQHPEKKLRWKPR
jgi:5-methylcytosine-specific restriction endonuclease McrA